MIYNCKHFIYVPVKSDVKDQKVAKVSKYLADSEFFKNFLYQGGVKSTVSLVFLGP